MSDIVLASKYSAKNYPPALKNLAKRYNRQNSDEPINYSKVGFGDISEDQASVTLRFFADIGLLENPKGANYIPPQSVIDWQLKMGETSEQGKQKTFEKLNQYDVFSEIIFLLEESDKKLSDIVEQVGGIVGIDEDESSQMEKTIEVFAECGFLNIGEDNTVSLVYHESNNPGSQGPTQSSSDESIVSQSTSTDTSTNPTLGEMSEEEPTGKIRENGGTIESPTLNIDVQLSVDATEMEASDLRKKLDIIDEMTNNDGE